MGLVCVLPWFAADIYKEIQNILDNKTDNYIDDIVQKIENIFFQIFSFDKNTSDESNKSDESSFFILAYPFIKLEKKEKFLFLKIVIPLMEKLKIYKSKNLSNGEKEDKIDFEQYMENKLEKHKIQESEIEKFLSEPFPEDKNADDIDVLEKYKLYFSFFYSFLSFTYNYKFSELDFPSIYNSLFGYIKINLQNINITNDEDIKKEIKNLIEYLLKFSSLKYSKSYYELIIFSLQMYLIKYDFYEEELLHFEKAVLQENLNENNIILLIEKNIYDFKYKLLTFVEKKRKSTDFSDSKLNKIDKSLSSIHIYEPKKLLMKFKYMNAIIYENQIFQITGNSSFLNIKEFLSIFKFGKKEILILKINLENYKEEEKFILNVIDEISAKLNNFKSFEKIYFNFDNKLIFFNKTYYNDEAKYKVLKDEMSETINKMKLREEIKSQESETKKLMEEKFKEFEHHIFDKEKKIEMMEKEFNVETFYNIANNDSNKAFFTYLIKEKNNLEKEKEKKETYNKEYNELNDLKQQLECLKEKNTIVGSLGLCNLGYLCVIKRKNNGGKHIDVEDCVDNKYNLNSTLNKLAKEIDKSKNNKINIYFLGNDKTITTYKNNLKGEEIVENLESDEDLEEKVSNTINEVKIKDLSETIAHIKDELYYEKIKNNIYKNENLKKENSKLKESLYIKFNKKIKNQDED